jgi:diadenosine tetraphosphate (Ap4A) HIT family hydrolase
VANPTSSTTRITFSSQQAFETAFAPIATKEMTERTSASATHPLQFVCDASCQPSKLVSLRTPGTGNLLKTKVHETPRLTLFYPEAPRVAHHLAIALNREVDGIGSVSTEENQEIFATIRKIAEVYKSVNIRGYVVAHFDKPQQGHLGRYVVEVIPSLTGFKDVVNVVDKVDCNRHVLFRTANLSPIDYKIDPDQTRAHAEFWQKAFQEDQKPLTEDDTQTKFPYTIKTAYMPEALKVLKKHLLEILQDKGAQVEIDASFKPTMPTEIPGDIQTREVAKCVFCDGAIVKKQLVFEYNGIYVFYNTRKGPKPGSNFMILPKRHTEKIYTLTNDEIHNMALVRKALVEVLNEVHPECEVVIYTQDDPSTGQSVFHSHDQVVAIDPNTIPLTWVMQSIYSNPNVTDEEMGKVREQFKQELASKMGSTPNLENVV